MTDQQVTGGNWLQSSLNGDLSFIGQFYDHPTLWYVSYHIPSTADIWPLSCPELKLLLIIGVGQTPSLAYRRQLQ